jgi:spoIIIJ-associated protein
MEKDDIEKIKKVAEEFFKKMTTPATKIDARVSTDEDLFSNKEDILDAKKEAVILSVFLEEPQALIGQGGKTLFEAQRIIRMILNKKLKKIFYLDLDINEYKSKKTEYLKSLAKDLADQVVLTKETKILFPMPSYERRIVHKELSKRSDIISESHGDGEDRHIVIKAK